MHKGKHVFSQLLDFLDRNDFNYLARKYGGDKYVKQFTCYNQLCVLMFGQLSNRESLRDVVLATQAHASKAYLGFTHLDPQMYIHLPDTSKNRIRQNLQARCDSIGRIFLSVAIIGPCGCSRRWS